MIPEASESARYDYPDLTPESLVVDVGAYQGNWAKEIAKKYGCTVLGFEPIKQFFLEAGANCRDYPKVILTNCGLGGRTRHEDMGVQNDSTGIFATSKQREVVTILEAVPHLKNLAPGGFGLIKVNIEAMEFELLEHILDEKSATMFHNIQVQPHPIVPDWERRWASIDRRLQETHDLMWHTPWVWSGYKLRT